MRMGHTTGKAQGRFGTGPFSPAAPGRKGAFAPVLMIWCIENLGTQVYVTQTSVSDASDSLSVCF